MDIEQDNEARAAQQRALAQTAGVTRDQIKNSVRESYRRYLDRVTVKTQPPQSIEDARRGFQPVTGEVTTIPESPLVRVGPPGAPRIPGRDGQDASGAAVPAAGLYIISSDGTNITYHKVLNDVTVDCDGNKVITDGE